jgi:Fur-regulated basic protein A
MDELIKVGVYKKEDKHLYELTLTDLEEEYKDLEENGLAMKEAGNDHEIQV